ncbi:WbqC family protein [Janthinobacterium sp. Mn2066]|uniref:WbqC family protein n=1 Tax=Janthinobacterium sp. Mn2066 TaxID=3395264 RepID=UPI003BE5848A
MAEKITLGIMQPYFFPYLGYFDLINRSDRWIVFDVVRYAPKSWMNRNRILHPSEGWQYVSAPVDRHAGAGLIKDVTLITPQAAHDKIQGQILHYRAAGAPYFDAVSALISQSFAAAASGLLRDLNVASLAATCAYLEIPFQPQNLSDLDLHLPEIPHAGAWALEISAALGAQAYLNPPGGKDIFHPAEWAQRGIELGFTELVSFTYPTRRYQFIEHLSILDVLMWNPPATVKAYLDSRKSAKPA